MPYQLKASIIQRPVGQGGFCEGQVSFGGVPLRWIFDCGSNQIDALAREIEIVGNKIDILFISHYDADHINGIDKLLCKKDCVEVVLPYLTDGERLVVLSHAVSQSVSGQFIDFIADPAGWAIRRGVTRVTYLRPSDEGETDPPPDAVGEGGAGDLTTVWSRGREPIESATGADVGIAPAGSIVSAQSGKSPVGWNFTPHVFVPPPKLVEAFWLEVQSRFPGQTVREVIESVWTADGRANLRACYDALWVDHNLVSMSLHVGPSDFASERWWVEVSGRRHGYGQSSMKGLGWLSTGDADLSRSSRRRQFLTAYRRYLEYIGVLVLPHHGAAASFHAEILRPLIALRAGVAAAGPNSYGHPSKSVQDQVNALGHAAFYRVGQNPESLFAFKMEMQN